jgi:hypothetical protein
MRFAACGISWGLLVRRWGIFSIGAAHPPDLPKEAQPIGDGGTNAEGVPIIIEDAINLMDSQKEQK